MGTCVDDFQSFSIKNHMGEGITTILGKPKPETSPLVSIEDRLIEGVQDYDADIRSHRIQNLKGNLATK